MTGDLASNIHTQRDITVIKTVTREDTEFLRNAAWEVEILLVTQQDIEVCIDYAYNQI